MHGEAGAAAPLSHDPDVTTVTLRIEEPVSLEGVKVWMDTLLWESAAVVDIFRVKGLLCVAGSDCKHGLQVPPSPPTPFGYCCSNGVRTCMTSPRLSNRLMTCHP